MRLTRLALAAEPGAHGEIRLDWPYTQSDLAAMIGGTRQSVNKLLSGLVDEDLITDRARHAGHHRRRQARPARGSLRVADRPPTEAVLEILRASAQRARIGRRLQGDPETALLQSIVDATVTLFDAEAASIAIFERDPDRLEFRVAAGEQGVGAIGLSVPPSKGIAGFVFSTGQPLALSDVMSDPRFDRATAERTGYVPRSHRRRAARRRARRGHGRRPAAPRQAHLTDVHAAGHGAARRLRAPGRGRHPRDPHPARPRSSCCAPGARRMVGDDLDTEAIDDHRLGGDGRARPRRPRRRSGASSTASLGCGALGERESALVADLLDLLIRYAGTVQTSRLTGGDRRPGPGLVGAVLRRVLANDCRACRP